MKKFEALGKILSKEEQKEIYGSDAPLNVVRRGLCAGGPGEWIYTPAVDYPTCSADITAYCASGNGACLTWF